MKLKEIKDIMNIKELGDLVFYKMENYHQITIDLVDTVEDLLGEDISLDEIGSVCYDINNILEVINPSLIDDIDVLTKLKNELYKIKSDLNK
jgi:hypothetical protein